MIQKFLKFINIKKMLPGIFLLTFAAAAFGQINETAPAKPKLNDSSEAFEAFKNFDFTKLSINPNNLTKESIKDLRNNFFSEVKPYLLEKGEYVERLERVAEPVFLFHKSGKSQIVVFNHRLPTVFTWKETFVSFSTAAMDLLTDDEIAALVAHEIGHLYFAEALAKAREEKNDRLARVIELKCDLVALVTLSKLKIKPDSLITAVKKLIEGRAGLRIDSLESGGPALKSREEILKLYAPVKKQ